MFNSFQNFKFFKSEGAFYIFLDIRKLDVSKKSINFANSVKITENIC